MTEAVTNAVFLQVDCGQVFTTRVNGVAVVIDTRGGPLWTAPDPPSGGAEWTPPEPPSGGGGTIATVRINQATEILDLGALVDAVREDVLGEYVRPLRRGQSAAIEIRGPRGGRGSLDAMVIRPDA